MILRHQPVQVVNEAVARELRVFEVAAEMDRFDRAYFLAHTAVYAAELVDLINDRIAVALIVLTRHQPDAVRRTHGRAQPARHAFRTAVRVLLHDVRATPARRKLRLLVRILLGDLVGIDQMLEGQRHALEGGAQVRGLRLGTSYGLNSY